MSPTTPNDGQDNHDSSVSVQDDEVAQRIAKEQANTAAAAAQKVERDRAAACDDALARALEAEQEAEAAAQERDDAAKRTSNALARAQP